MDGLHEIFVCCCLSSQLQAIHWRASIQVVMRHTAEMATTNPNPFDTKAEYVRLMPPSSSVCKWFTHCKLSHLLYLFYVVRSVNRGKSVAHTQLFWMTNSGYCRHTGPTHTHTQRRWPNVGWMTFAYDCVLLLLLESALVNKKSVFLFVRVRSVCYDARQCKTSIVLL